ncbi:hypothetical protein [Bacillus sp. Bos-x628]
MAAAGYIPIVSWAGRRILKGGKAIYKTTQATTAAIRAVDIFKTSQKSFDVLKTSQKGFGCLIIFAKTLYNLLHPRATVSRSYYMKKFSS